jgi:hypothetical protein
MPPLSTFITAVLWGAGGYLLHSVLTRMKRKRKVMDSVDQAKVKQLSADLQHLRLMLAGIEGLVGRFDAATKAARIKRTRDKPTSPLG